MLSFTILNLKSASFHILCTILSIVNFYSVLSMFPFLFFLSHLKPGTVHSSNSSLFPKKSVTGQSQVPAATAGKEEQYNSSNIIYIGL